MKKILKYEVRQLLRDKKTIILVFVLPLVIFPLLNGVLTNVITSRVGKIFEEKTEVVSYDEPFLKNVLSEFDNDSIFSVVYAEKGSSVDSLLNVYPAVVTLEYNDSLRTNLIIVNYSSKKDRQSIQAGAFIKDLRKIRKSITESRYSEIGIRDYYKNSIPQLENAASHEDMRQMKNAGILPMTIILILVLGTFVISNYVILAEKDNNTLESLLSSGVKRRDIIYGKMSIVMLAGMIMSVLELVSFFFYGRFTGSLSFDMVLYASQIFSLIPVLLSLSMFISSVSVFISCRLTSSSSGQLLFLPVMLTYLVLGLMGTFEGIIIRKGLLLIPVVNSAGIIKAVLRGDTRIFGTVSVIALNLIYSFIVVKSASGYLGGEDVLDKNTDTDIVKKGFSKGAVFTIFALLAVSYMMIGGYLQGRNIITGLVYSQILILGAFVAIMKRTLDKPFSGILKLRRFPVVFIPSAVFLGLFARYPISLVSEWLLDIFPVPDIMKKSDIMSTGIGNLNIFAAVAVIALLPAVFEEFTFRGVFLTVMEKKFTKFQVIVFTGFMFGAMHLNVFTLFETSVLGMVMGILTVYSGSIYPAVIMHFTNNCYSIVVMFMLKNGDLTENHFLLSNIQFARLMSVFSILIVFYLIFRKKVSAS